MVSLAIEGPGGGAKFVTAEEAAAFLRVHEDTFERSILPRYPWVRGRKVGGRKVLYVALDVAVLAYLIERGDDPEPPVKGTISGEQR